ncbi:hypothetical protein F4859DRAFT_524426 [Xylaria cf. heliscus]|nr:hypothetical protein F4859DRAFT_524426 [Xylaria cf. heliscus]
MEVHPIPRELYGRSPPPTPVNRLIRIHPSEPRPAAGGRFYEEIKQRPSMTFKFCPNPSKFLALRCQEWIACLEVKCFDVPRLMREGFHWDASNIIKEEGYYEYGKGDFNPNAFESVPSRWYFLTDTHQPRRWVASLRVMASDCNVLYNFQPSRLSRELVRSVCCLNHNDNPIYGYRAYTAPDTVHNTAAIEMMGFNMIYDKMPMEGFWPWPPIVDGVDAHGSANGDNVSRSLQLRDGQ